MAILKLQSNNASNPLTLDLSQFMDVQDGKGMDVAAPAFTSKIWARSLLKEGATMALEQLTEKELVFPLILGASLAGPWTNQVPNPSFEYDTIGSPCAGWVTNSPGAWLNTGAAQTAQLGGASGAQSMRVVTTSGAAFEGASVSCGVLPAGTYTASVFVKGNAGGESIGIVAGRIDAVGNGQTTVTATTSFVRWSVTFTADGITACGMAVRTPSVAAAITFFADCAMVTAGATLPPVSGLFNGYVDGDQFGCQWLGPPGISSSSGPTTARMVQQINQVVETPGHTVSWQPDHASQPTVFDGISGQFDVQYSFRKEGAGWTAGVLRAFTQPLGRTVGPRPYAAASGVGPLLMISPYASGGALAVGASTQAGVAGWGGAPAGASSGVFYQGNPELAGDAPALLQITVTQTPSPGSPSPPSSNTFTSMPYMAPLAAVSLLPDASYQVLQTNFLSAFSSGSPVTSPIRDQYAVASAYTSYTVIASSNAWALPIPSTTELVPTAQWSGLHRLFAIARASAQPGVLKLLQSSMVKTPTTASVMPGAWQLYDLGTVAYSASIPQQPDPALVAQVFPGPSAALDITSFAMLPDATTWYINPYPNLSNPDTLSQNLTNWDFQVVVTPSVFGPGYLLDDVDGHQFLLPYVGKVTAPSPAQVMSAVDVTAYSRGLVPRPDPKNGIPIIAILTVGQASAGAGVGASNPQTRMATAQVNVLERTRYVLP